MGSLFDYYIFSVIESKAKKRAQKEEEPNLDEWVSKRAKRLNKEGNKEKDLTTDTCRSIEKHVLPDILVNIPNLPISLLPPPPEAFLDPNIQDWG